MCVCVCLAGDLEHCVLCVINSSARVAKIISYWYLFQDYVISDKYAFGVVIIGKEVASW